MENRVINKIEEINIYGTFEKAGIDHQRLAVSNLLVEFHKILAVWKANPTKFRTQLSKLRDKAIEPYLVDPDKYANDIIILDSAYSHIVAYVTNVYDPIIEEYIQSSKRQRKENLEWI